MAGRVRNLRLLIETIGARGPVGDLQVLKPCERVRKRPPIRFNDGKGVCSFCGKAGAISTCNECDKLIHLACCKITSPVMKVRCSLCVDTDSKTVDGRTPGLLAEEDAILDGVSGGDEWRDEWLPQWGPLPHDEVISGMAAAEMANRED